MMPSNGVRPSINFCRTPEGRVGECSDIRRCMWLMFNVEKMRQSVCLRNLVVPGVCCPTINQPLPYPSPQMPSPTMPYPVSPYPTPTTVLSGISSSPHGTHQPYPSSTAVTPSLPSSSLNNVSPIAIHGTGLKPHTSTNLPSIINPSAPIIQHPNRKPISSGHLSSTSSVSTVSSNHLTVLSKPPSDLPVTTTSTAVSTVVTHPPPINSVNRPYQPPHQQYQKPHSIHSTTTSSGWANNKIHNSHGTGHSYESSSSDSANSITSVFNKTNGESRSTFTHFIFTHSMSLIGFSYVLFRFLRSLWSRWSNSRRK